MIDWYAPCIWGVTYEAVAFIIIIMSAIIGSIFGLSWLFDGGFGKWRDRRRKK